MGMVLCFCPWYHEHNTHTHTDDLYLDWDRHVGHSKFLLLLFTTMRSFPWLSGLAVMYSWSRSQRSRSQISSKTRLQRCETHRAHQTTSDGNSDDRSAQVCTCCNACHVCIGNLFCHPGLKRIVQFQRLDLVYGCKKDYMFIHTHTETWGTSVRDLCIECGQSSVRTPQCRWCLGRKVPNTVWKLVANCKCCEQLHASDFARKLEPPGPVVVVWKKLSWHGCWIELNPG